MPKINAYCNSYNRIFWIGWIEVIKDEEPVLPNNDDIIQITTSPTDIVYVTFGIRKQKVMKRLINRISNLRF